MVGMVALALFLIVLPLAALMVYLRHRRQKEGPQTSRPVPASSPVPPVKEKNTPVARPGARRQRCVACGRGLRVIRGKAGKSFRCPGCSTVQKIRV